MNMKLRLVTAVAILSVAHCALGQVTLQNAYDEFVKAADVLKEGDMKAYHKYPQDEAFEFTEYSSPFKIKNIVKENGKVASFEMEMSNYESAKFVPNHKETPVFWKKVTGEAYYKFAIIYKENILIGETNGFDHFQKEFLIIGWVKIGSGKKGLFQGMFQSGGGKEKAPFTKQEVLDYLKPFIEANKQRLENEEKNKNAAAEAHREKHSIKGKDVSKIEIEVIHEPKLACGNKFKYGVVATLKDGTVIKTKELGGEGYIDDYEFTINGNLDTDYLKGHIIGLKPYAYKNDYIQIVAKSKHHPSVTTTSKKYVLTYDQPITLDFSGLNSTGEGNPGKSLRIDVKVINHSETKEEVLEYRVYDDQAKMLHQFRLRRDIPFKVVSNGGKGGDKSKDSQGGKGGDGGNISLNLDPKVGEDYQFDYQNFGGQGGINKDYSYKNGAPGRDGRFTKTVKTIN